MRTALLELRSHPGRFLAVLVAIAISVAFLVASLVFTSTETRAIGRSVTARTSASDLVVELGGPPSPGLRDRLARVPGVSTVEASYTGYVDFTSEQGTGQLRLDSLAVDPRLQWATLSSGRWPGSPTEVAVDLSTAEQYGLSVGQQLTVSDVSGRAGVPLRLTGVTDQSRSLFSGLGSSGFVTDSYFTSRTDVSVVPELLVLADPTASPDTVADRLTAVLPPDSTARTSAQVTAEALSQLTRGADVFRYLLLVFGAIALLVGSILITNTFTILLVQRRRQIGLLRAVGASTAQVRRTVLAEAGLVGGVGSLVGVGLGLGIGAAAAAVSGSLADGLSVPVVQVLAAGAVGLAMTVLASLLPAARAMRVAPLEALRPVADELTARRTSVRLRNVSFLVVAIGAVGALLAIRAPAHNVVLAIAASMVLAVGIVLAAPLFLPLVLRGAGALAGRAGPVTRLAAVNTVRNPARAAATCTALMLGVGLIVTLQVGAASVRSTVESMLEREFPVDVTVANPDGALSPDVLAAVAAIPGLAASTPVRMTTAGAYGDGTEPQQLQVAGLSADAGRVVAAGFDQLTDQAVLAHTSTLKQLGVEPGQRLTLSYDRHAVGLTAVASDVAGAGTVVVTDEALTHLAPRARVSAVWARVDDRADPGAVAAEVSKASGRQPGLEVGGSLGQSAALAKLLTSLLAVATGLLAVAVLIALIGVGNTLGLSVIERGRESALLRALGLQRRELRAMLAVEAGLLALVGAGVGIAAGMLFGVIGTAALAAESELGPSHVSVSPGQTLAVLATAVLAGVLASLLPGRRAAGTAPTAALAEA